jgi:hypothetical protein
MNRKYTQEHIEFIATNIKGCPFKDLTDMFNKRFGTNLKVAAMISLADRHGLHNGRDTTILPGGTPLGVETRFKPGLIPWNKGKKGINYEGMKATQFKKGNKAHNWVPIGSERINGDGYVDVKVDDGKLQKNWKGKHILIWEAANGPVPPGHVVIFGDGDKMNVVLENLVLVSRAQLVRMNQNRLIQNDAELTRVGVLVADVSNKIGALKRSAKKRNGRGEK